MTRHLLVRQIDTNYALAAPICAFALLLPSSASLAQDGPNSSLYSGRMMPISRSTPSTGAVPTSAGAPHGNGNAAALQPLSWYHVPVAAPKEVKINDIVTIRVDLGARFSSDAQLQRRRTSQYDAVLNDWLIMEGLKAIKPAPQSDGDQRVQGNLNQLNRVTGQLDTTESLKFDIAATVASVLPNGNIVLEAHQTVRNNNEHWMHSLSGICRREDIGPGNIVISEDIANLQVEKRELGQIRDSYKRGWLSRWWDQFGPF